MGVSIRVAGILFSPAATANIEETGVSESEIVRDRRAISSGQESAETLLARCMRDADEDRADGWRDYVAALVNAAETENQSD